MALDVFSHLEEDHWGITYSHLSTTHILERCESGKYVANYFTTPKSNVEPPEGSFKWFAGRDTYIPVCSDDDTCIVAYCVLTEFGYDSDETMHDSNRHVRADILKNLQYTKAAGEAEFARTHRR